MRQERLRDTYADVNLGLDHTFGKRGHVIAYLGSGRKNCALPKFGNSKSPHLHGPSKSQQLPRKSNRPSQTVSYPHKLHYGQIHPRHAKTWSSLVWSLARQSSIDFLELAMGQVGKVPYPQEMC